MKNAQILYDAFQEKAELLLSMIKNIEQEENSNKDLHTLRVCVKKMRATLLLMDLAKDHVPDGKLQFKTVKPVFKKAGLVREQLICLKTLDQYWLSRQSARIYKKQARAEIKKNRKALLEAVRDFSPKELNTTLQVIKEICTAVAISGLRTRAKTFIAEKIALIHHMASREYNATRLHDIRIQVRILTSLGVLFQETGGAVMTQKRLKQLKHIEQLLGRWHDLVELNGFVKKYTAGMLEPAIRKEWKTLQGKWKIEIQDQVATARTALAAI